MSKTWMVWAFPLIVGLLTVSMIGAYAWETPDPIGRAGRAPEGTSGLALALGPTPTPDPNQVEALSQELYCPLCTGVRLDNCDLTLCDQMREVIRAKLAAGETKQEIKAFFIEQYGETVTGVPPKRGGMILVWVLPFLTLLAAGSWVYSVTRSRSHGLQLEEGEPPASPPLPPEYVERVERDLEQLR